MIPYRVLVCGAALLALGERPAEEIVLRVAEGTTLVRRIETSFDQDLVSLSMDGEEVPANGVDMSHRRKDRYVFTDVFETVTEGEPRRVRRTFDELGGSERSTFPGDNGTEEEESELSSELQGAAVVFRWSAESGAFEAAFPEEHELDPGLLEGLDEDLDLGRLLPGKAVQVGDEWSIDAACFEYVLDPGGDLSLRAKDDAEGDDSETDTQIEDNLSGTISARYTGTESADGARIAILHLTMRTSSHSEEETHDEELPEGLAEHERMELSFALEGELRWDLEHGHALSLVLEGDNDLLMSRVLSGQVDGEHVEQSESMHFTGPMRFELQCERR